MKSIIKSLALLLLFSLMAAGYSGAASAAAATSDFTIKVRLTNTTNKLGLSPTYHVLPKGSSFIKEAPTAVLATGKKYTIVVSGGKLSVKDGSTVLASGLSTVTVEPKIYAKENNVHLFKGAATEAHPYMGTVLFRMSGTTSIQPVNILQFEDYLKGVVPSEMSASWGSPASGGMEALKTQAIAARSYVFSQMDQSTLEIDDTTTYQVYKGFIWDPLSPKYLSAYQYSNQAVNETKGQILTYADSTGKKVFVKAYFSSSNGGQTEIPEQYWRTKLPYLSATQKDSFDTKNVTWQLNWLKNQLPANADVRTPANWWGMNENNLNSTLVPNLQSRNSFASYKSYILRRAKAVNPSVESIKIASIDSIATTDYANTGKVKETKVDLTYYTRNNVNNTLKYDMAPGAASETLFGQDRYATAAAIASESFGATKAKSIVLGRGDVPADALAGTVLAHKVAAPIMLVQNNAIPESVNKFLNEKTEAGAMIYLLGGDGAISEEIKTELEGKGFKTKRLYGKDRTGTSIAIAQEVGTASKVLIASGDDRSSDALSASAYAAFNQIPIIIQRGTKLAEQTRTFLTASNSATATIIGGDGAVSQTAETELKGMGLTTDRISGLNRVETSIAINKQLPMDGTNVVIGNGYQFIDALAGSVLAAKTGSPIVMLHPEPKNLPTEFFDAMPVKNQAYFLGGSSIISDELKTDVNNYLGTALKKHHMSVTFNGTASTNGNPTMSTFRTTLGGINLKSQDFNILDQSDRLIINGSGFGHGVGLSQWGAYRRAQAGQTAEQILKFYYQGVTIEHTSSYVNN